MKHTEGRFEGRKGLSLFYQCWLPEAQPKAMLMVVPGLAEHSGRYGNLVNYFVPRDYAVCGHDPRGHGRSEGVRCHVDQFSDYVDDLRTFFEIVSREHGGLKVFLVGHSMGAAIALPYAVRYPDELAGLILSGAALMAGSSVPGLAKALARVVSLLLPRIGIVTIDATTISRDKAVVNAYVNDPLVYRGKISARAGLELLRTVEALPSQVPGIKLPILIMHGTEDRLSDPASSTMLYERVGSKDKTLKLYEGFYHEIFNEPGHEQVMADVEAWLAEHI